MRPQIIIGIVIAAVILAAGYLAPTLFPPASRQALPALEQAELARRELHRYAQSYALPRVQRQVELEGLKQADAQQLLELSQQAFEALAQQSAELIRQAQQSDRALGLPATKLAGPRADAGSVRTAISGFEQAYRQHETLFQEVAQHARAARQAGRQVPGVAHILGMVNLLKASRLLDEAQHQRSDLQDRQAKLLALAIDWKLTQAEADHYAGLDPAEIVSDLQNDLAELVARKQQALARTKSLEDAVRQRKQTLAQLRAQLGTARGALLKLEEQSFVAGDDASFNAYRQRYREIADRLRALEQQEQLLSAGGRREPPTAGDDAESAPPQPGEVVEGLEQLERRLALAAESAQRLVAAEQTLGAQIEYVRQSGKTAREQAARFAARLEELRPKLDAELAALAELAQAADQKEQEALQAAREAVQAFRDSSAAARAWKRAAADLQRSKDPERKNARLKMIASDAFVDRLVDSAEGVAKMLVARILAQRVNAISTYLDALERYAQLHPGYTPDREPLETAIQTARQQAIETLNDCCQIYQKLASGPTGWLAQSSLAVAYYRLAKLDLPRAAEHLSLAVDHIRNAIQNERSPYQREQVAFLAYLRAQGAVIEEEPPAAGESEAQPAQEQLPPDAEG